MVTQKGRGDCWDWHSWVARIHQLACRIYRVNAGKGASLLAGENLRELAHEGTKKKGLTQDLFLFFVKF